MSQIIFGEFADRHNPIYPQDRVVAQQACGRFAGEVTNSWEEQCPGTSYSRSVRIIDNAVRVESIDARTRKQVLDSFANLEEELKQLKAQEAGERNKGLLATGLGGVATIVPITLMSVLAPPVVIAAVVTGLVLTIFGSTYAYRHQQVCNQADMDETQACSYQNQWKDPLPELQSQRRQAGKGFVKAHRNGWKGSIIHPEELVDLWVRDLSTQRKQSTVQIDLAGQTNFVKQVFRMGLLSRAAFADVRGVVDVREGVTLSDKNFLGVDSLAKMVEQYEVHHDAYTRLNSRVDSAITQIHASRSSTLVRLDGQQEQWLIPARLTRNSASHQARDMWDRALAPLILERDEAIAKIKRDYCYVPTDVMDLDQRQHKQHVDDLRRREIANVRRQYDHDPLVRQINRDWQQQQEWIDFMYLQAAAPVIQWFDQQRDQVRHEEREQIAFVDRRREEETVRFFQPLKQILSNEDPSLGAQPPFGNFSWSPWQPRTSEPAFHQFYMRPPAYRPDFRNRVSESVWNLFMGQEGVYGFSGRRRDQWNTCRPTFGSGWPGERRRAPVGSRSGTRFRPENPVPPPPHSRATAFAGTTRR